MNILKQASAFFGLSNEHTDELHALTEAKFMEHVANYGLSFGTQEEYNFRLMIFAENDQYIQKINTEQALVQSSYWLAHNKFSTWSDMEFKKMHNRMPSQPQNESLIVELPTEESPDSVDWRTKGAVNSVQD